MLSTISYRLKLDILWAELYYTILVQMVSEEPPHFISFTTFNHLHHLDSWKISIDLTNFIYASSAFWEEGMLPLLWSDRLHLIKMSRQTVCWWSSASWQSWTHTEFLNSNAYHTQMILIIIYSVLTTKILISMNVVQAMKRCTDKSLVVLQELCCPDLFVNKSDAFVPDHHFAGWMHMPRWTSP